MHCKSILIINLKPKPNPTQHSKSQSKQIRYTKNQFISINGTFTYYHNMDKITMKLLLGKKNNNKRVVNKDKVYSENPVVGPTYPNIFMVISGWFQALKLPSGFCLALVWMASSTWLMLPSFSSKSRCSQPPSLWKPMASICCKA